MAAIDEARELATSAHRGATRKGSGLPYVVHPERVAELVGEHGGDEALVAAAWLHDVVEDTPETLAGLRSRFGERVAELVDHVTEPDKALRWEERKRAVLAHLATVPQEAAVLKAADVIANAEDLIAQIEERGDDAFELFSRGRELQLWWYASLVESLSGPLGEHAIGERMREVVARLQRAAHAAG